MSAVTIFLGRIGGIGKAVAERFYACGARLILTDLSQEVLEATFAGMDKDKVLLAAMNVTDMSATKTVARKPHRHCCQLPRMDFNGSSMSTFSASGIR